MAAATVAVAAATKLVPHLQVSFTWRVEGLTAARIAGADTCTSLRSPTFTVGDDAHCCIELYMRGCCAAQTVYGAGLGGAVLVWPAALDSTLICVSSLATLRRSVPKMDVTLAAAGHEHHAAAVTISAAGVRQPQT